MRRPVGAEPAAIAPHGAPGPVDEDAAARPRVAAAEPLPASGRDLLEQRASGEGVAELPDRRAGPVVAELRAARVPREPRLRARAGEDRVQLGNGRLLVCGIPRPSEPLAEAAEPVDVRRAGDAGRVGETVPCQEALRDADVTQAFGIRLELVPGVEEGDRERGAVARLEGSLRSSPQSRDVTRSAAPSQ